MRFFSGKIETGDPNPFRFNRHSWELNNEGEYHESSGTYTNRLVLRKETHGLDVFGEYSIGLLELFDNPHIRKFPETTNFLNVTPQMIHDAMQDIDDKLETAKNHLNSLGEGLKEFDVYTGRDNATYRNPDYIEPEDDEDDWDDEEDDWDDEEEI